MAERTRPHLRRFRLPAALLLAAGALACALPGAAAAATETLTFAPDADTYVDAEAPATAFGTRTSMTVDASPGRHAFLRFWVAGLAGRQVTGARLRMTAKEGSNKGGRIFTISSPSWLDTMTWDTRPLIDGLYVGGFGAVSAGSSYAAALAPGTVGEGVLSLGMDSTSGDGASWQSGESSTPPRLEVDVETAPGFVADGLSVAASAAEGSSDPTYFGTNRRLAETAGGRTLAVHGRHSSGVQLRWRDPAGGWQTRSTGAVADGGLLTGTRTGDWPASIAVARDASGAEHAWVVWSRPKANSLRPVQMRRLTGLDDPAGPHVGPVVTVDAPPLGAYRADVAFERRPDGTVRGALLWSRRAAETTYEVVTAWFDPFADSPAVEDPHVLYASTSSDRFGTLVASPRGTGAVLRGGSGRLTLHGHAAGNPPTSWSTGTRGPTIGPSSAPSAVALANGDVLVAVEHDTVAHNASVYRFPILGTGVVKEIELTGHKQPTIASDGTRAVVVAVRETTGHLVSRTRSSARAWSTEDRLEIGAEARAALKYPNALRDARGRLRVLVEGLDGSEPTSTVLGYQRPF